MRKNLQNFISEFRPKMESALFEYLPLSRQPGAHRYNDALHYTIFPGGKRWRPLLTMLGGSLVGVTPENMFPAACAIEYLHSSSMIIDDLPAMDDASTRRGKPSLHRAYDESTAMLVALGLMNQSYSLLALTCQQSGHNNRAGCLINYATDLIGSNGMIGGQVVDLELQNDCLGAEALVSRNLKTTGLMRLMMTVGPVAINACERELNALSKFGESLGMAYQIYDDLLDELGETGIIGKPLKQDQRHSRPTFVSMYGVIGAERIALQNIAEGLACLQAQFGRCQEVEMLSEIANMVIPDLDPTRISKKCEIAIIG